MNFHVVALICASSVMLTDSADLQVCDVRHAGVGSGSSCQQFVGWDKVSERQMPTLRAEGMHRGKLVPSAAALWPA